MVAGLRGQAGRARQRRAHARASSGPSCCLLSVPLSEDGMSGLCKARRDWLTKRLALVVLCAIVSAFTHLPVANAVDSAAKLSVLRAAILDRLLAMPDVAAHKWNTGKPIDDQAQEVAVIDAAMRAGAELGLPGEAVRRAMTAQIEAAKLIQRDLISAWSARQAPRVESIPDLNSDLRPRIARATESLIEGLAKSGPHLRDCDAATVVRAQPEAIAAFPQAWDKAVDGVIAALGGPDRSACN